MRRFTLLFTWVVMGLALALCAQPANALPFSETLSGGTAEFFPAIDAIDGIGTVNPDVGGRLFLGGNEPVTIYMKIPIGVFATTATITTGGDILTHSVAGTTGSGGYLSVGSGLVDVGNPSLGLINETQLITQVGGGDWPDLASVDISAAVAGSNEIWVAIHANQDSWRNYGTRVDANAILTVAGEGNPIPEPMSMLLLGSGLMCLMLFTRRRK